MIIYIKDHGTSGKQRHQVTINGMMPKRLVIPDDGGKPVEFQYIGKTPMKVPIYERVG